MLSTVSSYCVCRYDVLPCHCAVCQVWMCIQVSICLSVDEHTSMSEYVDTCVQVHCYVSVFTLMCIIEFLYACTYVCVQGTHL